MSMHEADIINSVAIVRFGLEAKYRRLKKKQAQLLASIEATWDRTLAGIAVPNITVKGRKPASSVGLNSKWRDIVITKIFDAIVRNSGAFDTIRETRLAFDKVIGGQRTGDVEIDKAYMFSSDEVKTLRDGPDDDLSTTQDPESIRTDALGSSSSRVLLDDGDLHSCSGDVMVDIAAQMASLENEARKLAAVGRVGNVDDLGVAGTFWRGPHDDPAMNVSASLDQVRVHLASREAENFVESIIKKHGLDDDNYLENMEQDLSDQRAHITSRDTEAVASYSLDDIRPASRDSPDDSQPIYGGIPEDSRPDSGESDFEITEDDYKVITNEIGPGSSSEILDGDVVLAAEESYMPIELPAPIDSSILNPVDIPDFEVYEYISETTRNAVEEKLNVLQKFSLANALKVWQYLVSVKNRLKHHCKQREIHKCRAAIIKIGVYALESKATKARSILRMQCAVRVHIAKKRVQIVRKAHEARQNALSTGMRYIERIHLQYALRALKANRRRRMTLRRNVRNVQLAHIAPYLHAWKKAYNIVRISYAIRQFLARRRTYRQRCRRVRLAELNDGYPVIIRLRQLRVILRHWRVLRCCNVIFRLTYKWAYQTRVLRRWAHWKNLSKEYVTFRRDAATKMCATFRMHLSRRKYGNFYVVRKGILSLQCVVRGKIAQTVVAEVRRRHLAAIQIQRIARGYNYRINMRSNRITDIHNAAMSDNYDRLQYYLERYYNLTFQLDQLGNSALHNAAQHASKRCVKLLLRYHHDPTLVNPDGYSPLHLLIISSAPYRDSMLEYMLTLVGFDEFQRTGDGKTPLILAAEYGRSKIVSVLLDREHNPDDIDSYGSTALQYACLYGYEPIVRSLLEAGANVNIPGYQGMLPLHDVTNLGNVAITNMLLESGAAVDVQEPIYGHTPLMLACRNGMEEIVDLMLLQSPDITIRDYAECTVAHHCAQSDSLHIANALREADCDFNVVNSDGDSPLHYAARYGSVHCMEEFLHSLASPSLQNFQGNQPSHIAAQYNQVGCLKALLLYDEHIGRMNFKHMTPLGMAKFHMAKEAQLFLEEHFRKIDGPGIRNEEGEVWWDKELDKHLSDWHVVVDECNHRHYVNDVTGEVTLDAPRMKVQKVQKVAKFAQVPMQRKVLVQDEENFLNKHKYDNELKVLQEEIALDIQLYDAATVIEKSVRRKLAYMKVRKLHLAKERMDVLARFFVRACDTVIRWKLLIRSRKVARVQSLFRGYSLRCHFYYWDGTYEMLWYELQKRRLARTIWTLWSNFKLRQMQTTFQVAANAPVLITDWEPILDQVGYPVRTVGIIEEYIYPGTHKIYFYRNFETGKITFEKPKELVMKDRKDYIARTMLREKGYTPDELWLALKIQALWRGHKVRMMYGFIVRATAICVRAETDYLSFPDSDRNLFNYTLYCHVVLHDYTRARPLYIENLRRMAYKGPDVAQILYAYAIFSFVTHDQDVEECNSLIHRARAAEQQQYNYLRKQQHRAKMFAQKDEEETAYEDIPVTPGKSFELAHVGFFRYMCNLKNNSDGFHNYAVCRFLVYEDFSSAFDAFMGAFKSDPMNKRLRANYDAMLEHFFGSNQNLKDEIVNKRMQFLAAKDNREKIEQRARIELATLKNAAVTRIQKWYRHHRGLRDFYSFVARLRRKKKKN